MKIIGKVEFIGPIKKQSDKDEAAGLRFITIVREETRTQINGDVFKESIVYQIKSQQSPDIKVGEIYLIDGRVWNMANDGYGMRGLTNPAYEKYGKG